MEILSRKTRGLLEQKFRAYFNRGQGDDLNSAVQDVLSNRDIFSFLAAFLPDGQGLPLGKLELDSPSGLHIHYGLTINSNTHWRDLPRKTFMYNYQSPSKHAGFYKEKSSLIFGEGLNLYPDAVAREYPTPEAFLRNVNFALQGFNERLIMLPR